MNNPSPPLHNRRVWLYDRANVSAIRKSIEMYYWDKSFAEIDCLNEQVNLLTQVLINIFSNFIPNKIAKVNPQQAPWITKTIESFLRKRNRSYKSCLLKAVIHKRYQK